MTTEQTALWNEINELRTALKVAYALCDELAERLDASGVKFAKYCTDACMKGYCNCPGATHSDATEALLKRWRASKSERARGET